MEPVAGWIMLGLLAGSLARLVLPGEERGGWMGAVILGIVGAIVGGWIARTMGYLSTPAPGDWFPGLESIGSATVGSIVVLAMWKWIRR